jgi:nuclear receptor interaction protein
VSCAGDGDIRVFDVDRLQPADGLGMPSLRRARGALWGADGPGVRVLRCHRDRTKRIATEASPFLFLTVSEDGTVRQHDLRRPHTCRDECPPPLFQAPPRVDLYSLSVSPLTPHLFAVAGQTDCAYICDRRKPEHQTPSWGKHTRRAEQVTCVRRLALPQVEWESVERRNAVYRERHITCVKMSADNAGEVSWAAVTS